MIVKGFDELRERLSAFQKRRFCLAMSGHRNVLPSAVDAVKRGTWDALEFLRKTMGEPLCVLCGLAVGADQVVAEAVLRNRESAGGTEADGVLNSRDVLVAVLPMPRAIYEEDFERDEVVEFVSLVERADAVFELELESEGRQWLESHPGEQLPIELRMLQYDLLGEVLAREGDGLLALWDGMPVKCDADGWTAFWERGSTADVVRKFLELRNSRVLELQGWRVLEKQSLQVPEMESQQVLEMESQQVPEMESPSNQHGVELQSQQVPTRQNQQVPELQGWRVLKAGGSPETPASEDGPANHERGRVVHVAVPRTKKGQARFAAGLEAGEIRELTLDTQNPPVGEIS